MKVDSNAAVQKGLNEAQELNQAYLAMIVLNLLKKASSEILKSVQSYEMAIQTLQQNDGAKKSVGAAAPQTSSGDSETDAIVAALIAQLTTNQALGIVSNQTVQAVINYALSQLESLKQLQNEIQDLENKMKQLLTPDQIKQLESQIQALENQYNQALANYNKAQNDYNTAQEKYNQIKDKNSPEAQQLQKEMAQDKEAMGQASSSMTQAANQMAGLSQNFPLYPDLAQSLSALANAMKNQTGIANETKAVSQQVGNLPNENAKYSGALAALENQEQTLINQLAHGSTDLKKQLQELVNHLKELNQVERVQLMSKLLSELVVRQTQEHKTHHEDYKVAQALAHPEKDKV